MRQTQPEDCRAAGNSAGGNLDRRHTRNTRKRAEAPGTETGSGTEFEEDGDSSEEVSSSCDEDREQSDCDTKHSAFDTWLLELRARYDRREISLAEYRSKLDQVSKRSAFDLQGGNADPGHASSRVANSKDNGGREGQLVASRKTNKSGRPRPSTIDTRRQLWPPSMPSGSLQDSSKDQSPDLVTFGDKERTAKRPES